MEVYSSTSISIGIHSLKRQQVIYCGMKYKNAHKQIKNLDLCAFQNEKKLIVSLL